MIIGEVKEAGTTQRLVAANGEDLAGVGGNMGLKLIYCDARVLDSPATLVLPASHFKIVLLATLFIITKCKRFITTKCR
jgi:hypothetical protein